MTSLGLSVIMSVKVKSLGFFDISLSV